MGLFSFGKTEEENGQLSGANENFAIISFEPNGIIINANANFLEALGYNFNEIAGQHHKMFCDNKYTQTLEYQKFWEKLNIGVFDSGEYLRIGKNDKEIWIQASYNPIINMDGNPYKAVKYAQDITAKKKIAFAFENTSKKLVKMLE